MTNASRAQVDLDALARDLDHDTTRGPAKADPLAELARIVGQDDPFRALLAARDQMRAAMPVQPQAGWNGRVEPSFAPEPVKATPADAFDQYLASVEQDTHQDAPYAHTADAVQDGAEGGYGDDRPLKRVNPRRRLVSVGAGIAVVAVAVTGALTYKGMHSSGPGGVPVVQADPTPLKVAPKVADGVEIPDQNRQIYDPKGKRDGQIKIVNREEQPVDVAEAARAAQGPAAPGTSQAGTTPGNSPFEAFGEPRRVRTVAVKPETPPAPPARETQADAGPSPIPTMVLPGDEPAAPPPTPKAKATRQAAASLPPAMPAPVEAPPAPTPVEAPPPKPVAVKPPPKAAQRVATAGAVSIPDTTASTTTSDDAALRNGPVGGFAVQLGVRGSAAEARAALHQMQGKFNQLAGKPELIRQAEVNGKTIFRVRVGPLEKAEASSLCSALQSAGGQCFVAKN
ncbi:Cell division protein DedD (protein involved in septation) [Methylobacterium phyllostachyos]|uniref:Cell division protein DedD (Protein involved in septation) n=1 Tax=Methylobacterium phyllostachyos TaxID=582672 RepID=A0A1G9ZIG8_9HYPH|nr:SPOR domain-containing protein [Methylobacterium phyllostachyos]SDN20867.1 Cell division protein DedD (protein involved in septation) [Methylobacterium phyllostachyos]